MAKVGRPTKYCKKVADEICRRLAGGESLRTICNDEHLPSFVTVIAWLSDLSKPEFLKQYALSRTAQAELMFDELLEIADDGTNDLMTIRKGSTTYNVEDREVTNRSKLRVDTRKWYLSKVMPKKFGEKLDLTSDGKQLPVPIYGGASVAVPNPEHDGDQKDIRTP